MYIYSERERDRKRYLSDYLCIQCVFQVGNLNRSEFSPCEGNWRYVFLMQHFLKWHCPSVYVKLRFQIPWPCLLASHGCQSIKCQEGSNEIWFHETGAIFKASLFCYQSEGLPINESWSFRSSYTILWKSNKGVTRTLLVWVLVCVWNDQANWLNRYVESSRLTMFLNELWSCKEEIV